MRWATSSYDYYQSVTVLQNHLLSWSTLQQLRLYSKLLLFHKTINNLVTTLTIQSYYLAFNHADDSMPGYALYLHSQLQPRSTDSLSWNKLTQPDIASYNQFSSDQYS